MPTSRSRNVTIYDKKKNRKKLIGHNEHEEKTENNCLTNIPIYIERKGIKY